jgi:hypothetical protein
MDLIDKSQEIRDLETRRGVVLEGIKNENEIRRCLDLLITRLQTRTRGPIPVIVYENDILVSNRIEQSLLDERDHINIKIDAIRRAIKVIDEKKREIDTSKGLDKEMPPDMTDYEIIIYEFIKTWDKSNLSEIRVVSDLILQAIRNKSTVDISGISENTAISELMAGLQGELQSRFTTLLSGTFITDVYMSFIFIWFVGRVFNNPQNAQNLYLTDNDAKIIFIRNNLGKFGLPEVLAAIKK